MPRRGQIRPGEAQFEEQIEASSKQVIDSISELTRGITDHALLTDEAGWCAEAQNIIFNTSRRMRVHWGSVLIGKGANGLPTTAFEGIDALYSFVSRYLLVIAGGVFYLYRPSAEGIDRGTFERLNIGGTAVPLFTGRDYTFAASQNEVVVASGELERPLLLYADTSGQQVQIRGHDLAVPVVPDFRAVQGEVLSDDVAAGTFVYIAIFVRSYTSSGYSKTDFGARTAVEVTLNTNEEGTASAPTVTLRIPALTIDDDDSGRAPIYGDLSLRVYRSTRGSAGPHYQIHTQSWDGGQPIEVVDDLTVNTDSSISSGAALYTDTSPAPTPEFLPPPRARFVAQAGGRIYLGNTRIFFTSDGGERRGDTVANRVVFSEQGRAYAFPAANFLDVNLPVTGLGVKNNNCLIFTETTVHRVESTRAGPVSEFEFENETGLTAPRSLQSTTAGVFYASLDGIYLADGLKSIKISDHLSEFYQRIPRRENIYSVYDPLNYRVYFYYPDKDTDDRHYGRALVLDLLHTRPFRGGGSFTEYRTDGGVDEAKDNIRTAGAAYHQGRLYYGHKDGTVSVAKKGFFYHEVWDKRPELSPGDTFTASNLRRLPVHYRYLSTGLTCGERGALKELGKVNFTLREITSGVVSFFGVADGGVFSAEFQAHKSSLPDLSDQRATFGTSFGRLGATPVRSYTRPIHKEFRVISFYQVGIENGNDVEHTCNFRFYAPATSVENAGFMLLTNVDPVQPYSTADHPFVGYLFRISGVPSQTGITDEQQTALVGLEFAIVLDAQSYVRGDGTAKLRLAPNLDTLVDGLPADFMGTAELLRVTAADIEILDLSIYARFAGSSQKIRDTGSGV